MARVIPDGSSRRGGESAHWPAVPKILERIAPPRFPRRAFPLAGFGASPGGTGDCSAAFAAAVGACQAAGGGRVVVPPGIWLTGPIHLRSNVCLVVSDGAIVRFTTDPGAFLPAVPTRWEGVECLGYSPLVYACDAENVAVTGGGVLDGQASAEHWWPWKGFEQFGWQAGQPHQATARDRLFAQGEAGAGVSARVFGDGSFLRPSFIQMNRCRNVLVEGVTLRRAPMWSIHPVLCTNVVVRGVTVDSRGPNNDGCVPESCTDVLIEDCVFHTGDDCIAIKSGRNADGRRVGVPSGNIVIRRCRMCEGHGGVVIGSEVSGGCRNVFVEDCVMSGATLERALRIKTNSCRGGVVENVFLRRIRVGEVSDAVVRVNCFYEEGDGGSHPPVVRNIWLEDVVSRKSTYALFLAGFEHSPVSGVHVRNCRFGGVAQPHVLHNVADLDFDRVEQNSKLALPGQIATED